MKFKTHTHIYYVQTFRLIVSARILASDQSEIDRHLLLCGPTGSGKSFLVDHQNVVTELDKIESSTNI